MCGCYTVQTIGVTEQTYSALYIVSPCKSESIKCVILEVVQNKVQLKGVYGHKVEIMITVNNDNILNNSV